MRRLPILAGLLLPAILPAGCSSTEDVLDPSAIAAVPASRSAAAEAEGDAASAAISSGTRMRVDPIVGASVEAAIPLTERLATQARARRIAIAGSTDMSATHVLKGYFSTIAAGKDTTILYVWDVYDLDGNRLHRISGQHEAKGGAGSWSAASPADMQEIADITIDTLASWLAGHAG